MTQITVSLLTTEREALRKLARQERRDIKAQAAVLIRRELERGRLLTADANPNGAHKVGWTNHLDLKGLRRLVLSCLNVLGDFKVFGEFIVIASSVTMSSEHFIVNVLIVISALIISVTRVVLTRQPRTHKPSRKRNAATPKRKQNGKPPKCAASRTNSKRLNKKTRQVSILRQAQDAS